jgi:hypothetical protein
MPPSEMIGSKLNQNKGLVTNVCMNLETLEKILFVNCFKLFRYHFRLIYPPP